MKNEDKIHIHQDSFNNELFIIIEQNKIHYTFGYKLNEDNTVYSIDFNHTFKTLNDFTDYCITFITKEADTQTTHSL